MRDLQPITITRIYNDKNDVTHFVEDPVPWQTSATSGNAVTEMFPANKIGFLHLATGFASDWHPAPRKQYVLVLKGTMQIKVGDGQIRDFSAGNLLMVTDIVGRGHMTSVVGPEDVFITWVPVP